jgi:hypothetical protein
MMKKAAILFGLSLTTLALGGCQSEVIVDKGFTYQGIVLDSVSMTPLDSVEVVIGDTLLPGVASFTDNLGEYEFTTTGGTSQLTFRRQDYRTKIVNTNTATGVFVDSQIVLFAK